MSSIPKSNRSQSKLEAIHKAYQIRSRITTELLLSFGYSQKKLEKDIHKATSYIKDPGEKEEAQKRLEEMNANFSCWLIQYEREDVLTACKGIVNHLAAANKIYPTYKIEFTERRLQMDKALECCEVLQQELQYLAESLPADKNKYMSIVIDVENEEKMIKKLRQSDNRFLKFLKE